MKVSGSPTGGRLTERRPPPLASPSGTWELLVGEAELGRNVSCRRHGGRNRGARFRPARGSPQRVAGCSVCGSSHDGGRPPWRGLHGCHQQGVQLPSLHLKSSRFFGMGGVIEGREGMNCGFNLLWHQVRGGMIKLCFEGLDVVNILLHTSE